MCEHLSAVKLRHRSMSIGRRSGIMGKAIDSPCGKRLEERANQGSEISGDDDAHDACECDHPYRRRCSLLSIRVHLGAHNTSGATPLVARDCPLTSSLSQEEASVDPDWSGTDESSLFSPLVMVSSSLFLQLYHFFIQMRLLWNQRGIALTTIALAQYTCFRIFVLFLNTTEGV